MYHDLNIPVEKNTRAEHLRPLLLASKKRPPSFLLAVFCIFWLQWFAIYSLREEKLGVEIIGLAFDIVLLACSRVHLLSTSL